MSGERRKKFNAIFFAAVMVISMVAMGVGGLAGSAVAVTDTGDDGVTATPTTIGEESTHSFNVTVESGDSVIGQNLDEVDVDYTAYDNSAGTLDGLSTDDVTVIQDGTGLNVDAVPDGESGTISVSDGNEIAEGTTIEVQIDGVTNPGPTDGTEQSANVDITVRDDAGTPNTEIANLGLTVTPVEIDVSPESATVEVNEDQDYTVTLTDSEGNALDGVEVTATATADIDGIDQGSATTATDNEGTVTFTLSNAAALSETVDFSEDQSGNSTTADFTVEEAQISVDVSDFTGTAVNSDVRLEDADGNEVETQTGASSYTFDGLQSGTYTVNTTVDGYEAEETVDVEAAQPASDESVTLEVGPEITDLSAEEVVVGSTETITADITIADGDTVEYTVYNTSGVESVNEIASGSTTSDSFSFIADFDEVGEYTVVTQSQATEELEADATIESGYDVQNVEFDPETVDFGDSVTVSGQVVNADGDGVEGETAELEDANGAVVGSSSTVSTGEFSFTTTLNDAGQFNLSLAGSDIVYDSIEAGPEDADLNLSADEDPFFDQQSTFTIDVTDSDGDGLNFADDAAETRGYVNVTGPFDEESSTLEAQTDNVTRAVSDGDDGTAYVYVVTDVAAAGDGVAQFSATPSGDSVDASLEISDFVDDYSGDETVNGLEDNTIQSFESPDYVADSDSLAVGQLDALNLQNINPAEDFPVDETGETSLAADVFGADGELPGNSDELYNATIEVTGPNVTAEIVYESGDTTTQNVEIQPNQGGELELTATGFAQTEEGDAGEELGPVTDTVSIDGDLFENISPTEANVDDTTDVGVTVTDTDGEPINVGYDVTFTADADTFNASGVDAADTLRISTEDNVIEIGAQQVDTFSTTTGEYVAENITFEAAANINLVIEDASTGTRAFQDEAIDVGGIEVYDVESDVDPALAGANDQHNITVTEDGAEVNGSTLNTLAGNIEFSQADDTTNVEVVDAATTVDLSGDGTVDTIQATVRPENATETLDIDVEDNNDRTGTASLDVVEPEITTSLGDDALTEGVRSPDENQSSDSQYARFTSGTGTTTEPGTPACVYYYTPIHTGVAL